MGGRPVWLASLSRRDEHGKQIPTSVWSASQMRAARKVIEERALHGVGDPERERGFRMNGTLCVHRALADQEIARLPEGWMNILPRDLAGGPVEILWRTAKAIDALSTHPCENPGKQLPPNAADPRLWYPMDCGECPPCLARKERESAIG